MIQEIAFSSYAVKDIKKARDFYEGVLGLKPSSEYVGDTTAFIEYEIGPHTFAIGMGAENFTPGNTGGVVAFEATDFDILVENCRKCGVAFVTDVLDFPSCRMVVLDDPEGNRLMIHKRK